MDNDDSVSYKGARDRLRQVPMTNDSTGCTVPAQAPEGPPALSEGDIRALIKAQIPRWVRNHSGAYLVEEMEVCRGRARIDLAVISDQLIGIEIKGPKDDVSRLPGQAKAYSQCFDRVILVTHDHLASKAAALIPDWWGIIVGQQKNCRIRYRFTRRPETNPELNLEMRLALLWREEIDALYSSLAGSAAKRQATKRAVRTELISLIEPPLLRDASIKKLRERADWRWIRI